MNLSVVTAVLILRATYAAPATRAASPVLVDPGPADTVAAEGARQLSDLRALDGVDGLRTLLGVPEPGARPIFEPRRRDDWARLITSLPVAAPVGDVAAALLTSRLQLQARARGMLLKLTFPGL